MNVLRILLAAPLTTDRVVHWSLHDAAGTLLRNGRDVPHDLPPADRVEVVVAASQVRLAAVKLPPLPPNRIAAAAAFALEDRLAAAGEAPMLVVSPQRADGTIVVAVVARSLLASLASSVAGSIAGRIRRAVPEPELTSAATGWCWCAADDPSEGEGFVRTSDGSAFPVTTMPDDGTLPPELALALDHARRSAISPPQIRVDATATDDALVQWQADTGIAFVRGQPWRWNAASTVSFDAATNLLQGEFAAASASKSTRRIFSFKPAIAIALAALALHVIATIGEWAWWRVDAWRLSRTMRTVAVAAGASEADAAGFDSARLALMRRYAAERHAHKLAAPSDALPLLARAAPALAGTPPGTIKSATYADGHWTLDLQRADNTVVRDLDMRLKRTGTPAVTVATAAGARIRFGAD